MTRRPRLEWQKHEISYRILCSEHTIYFWSRTGFFLKKKLGIDTDKITFLDQMQVKNYLNYTETCIARRVLEFIVNIICAKRIRYNSTANLCKCVVQLYCMSKAKKKIVLNQTGSVNEEKNLYRIFVYLYIYMHWR